jgi:SAM-dependent methyltransferase
MTFPDNYFDLVITQDVLEHVMHPERAFADIARTLKPGGAHLFTVPIFAKQESLVRAVESNGAIQYLEKPDYHGNPIDNQGSLVFREWGEDIVSFIKDSSKLDTLVLKMNDRNLGIDGQFTDVLVSTKPNY